LWFELLLELKEGMADKRMGAAEVYPDKGTIFF
jgi:hypothetical protein